MKCQYDNAVLDDDYLEYSLHLTPSAEDNVHHWTCGSPFAQLGVYTRRKSPKYIAATTSDIAITMCPEQFFYHGAYTVSPDKFQYTPAASTLARAGNCKVDCKDFQE